MKLTKREQALTKAHNLGIDSVYNYSNMPEEYKQDKHLQEAFNAGRTKELAAIKAENDYYDNIGIK